MASFSGGNWASQLKKISKVVKDQKIKLAFNPGSKQLEAGAAKLRNEVMESQGYDAMNSALEAWRSSPQTQPLDPGG